MSEEVDLLCDEFDSFASADDEVLVSLEAGDIIVEATETDVDVEEAVEDMAKATAPFAIAFAVAR